MLEKIVISLIENIEALFIVPPFVTCRTPIMGSHILNEITERYNIPSNILYCNHILASLIEVDTYESICYGQPFQALGERLFARSAHNLPSLGENPDLLDKAGESVFGVDNGTSIDNFEYKFFERINLDQEILYNIEEHCFNLINILSERIAESNIKLLLLSSNWEQNNFCVSLINHVKEKRPDIITIIGGSNCEGNMAEGIASLSNSIDYIFSGESEKSFEDFLNHYLNNTLPTNQIIYSQPIENIEEIPVPDYSIYFEQLHLFFKNDIPGGITIGYESSRGCSWGKCDFCGMNGQRMKYRKKDTRFVMKDLVDIQKKYPVERVLFIDKMFPEEYINEFIPQLQNENNPLKITCEYRSNLDINELSQLKKANIDVLQIGIESLSTDILKLISKGVSVKQNIALLRNARSFGIWIHWNMLWGFPYEKVSFYNDILMLLPLIEHLQPPIVFRHMSIDKHSPYHNNPESYNIKNLRHWEVYNNIYPQHAKIGKLAYRFIGDYPCETHEDTEVIEKISNYIQLWKSRWSETDLIIIPFGGQFLIHDTRSIACQNQYLVGNEEVNELMNQDLFKNSDIQNFAIENKLAVLIDGWYIPLITSSPKLLMELEGKIAATSMYKGK